jgi:hypothetical protein
MNEINQALILVPVLALVSWTMLVLLLIPYRRFKAAFKGEVTPHDFAMGESDKVSNYVSLGNRNYMNLLEAPVLFYVAALVCYMTQSLSDTVLVLSWVYVVVRVLHSLVHVTYNHVVHRLCLFATSNFILAGIWVLLFGPVLTLAGVI